MSPLHLPVSPQVGAGLSSGAAAEAAGAGRRSVESVKGAERVLEALRVLREEATR